jgi:hypothetical protein
MLVLVLALLVLPALLLPAFRLGAAIRALIWPAFGALLFGRCLIRRGAFGRLILWPAMIRARAAPIRALVIPAGALVLARLKARGALLANPRRGGRAKLLFILGFSRDQPEAHGFQHGAQVFALNPQAAGQIPRQQGGRFTRQMPQFTGDAFRHIQAQQHRAGG